MTILTNIEEDRGGGVTPPNDYALDDIIDDNDNDNSQLLLLNKSNDNYDTNIINNSKFVNNSSSNNNIKYIKLEQDNVYIDLNENDNNNSNNKDVEVINENHNHSQDIKIEVREAKEDEKEKVEEVEEEDQFYHRPFNSELLINDQSITNRIKSVERGMNHISSYRDIGSLNNLSRSMELQQNIVLASCSPAAATTTTTLPGIINHDNSIDSCRDNIQLLNSSFNSENGGNEQEEDEEFEDILLERDNTDDLSAEKSKKLPPVSPFKQLLAMKLKSISSHIETISSGVDVVPVHREKYLTYPSSSASSSSLSSQLMSTMAANGKMLPNNNNNNNFSNFQTLSTSPSSSSSVSTFTPPTLSTSPNSLSSSPFKIVKPKYPSSSTSSSSSATTTTSDNLTNLNQNFTSMPNLLYNQNNNHRTSSHTTADSFVGSSQTQLASSNTSTSTSSSVTSTSSTSSISTSSISPNIHSNSIININNNNNISSLNYNFIQSNIQHQQPSYIINSQPPPTRKITPFISLSHSESGHSTSNITRPVLSSETNKIGSKLIFLLACSVFFSVSNLYYIQPLLNLIGEEFSQGPTVMSLVTMAVQAGYAVGLLFISTLGDIISKKKLILILSALTCISLIGVALSYHIAQMIVFQFIVGCSTIIPHIAIPLAIELSTPTERRSIIGILMSSLFVGLLGARVLSGIAAEFIGWRSVYYFASAIMFIISFFLFLSLPYTPRSQNPIPYNQLLRSIFNLFKLEPHLKQTCFVGSMVFATFSILWTTLSFQLNEEPFDFSSGFIGLFGLIGMAGAIASPIASKLHGRLSINILMIASLSICCIGYIILFFSEIHLPGIIAGIFILDLGVQACHITNQSRNHIITQIREELDGFASNASSYINAAYMASYFVGGAFGSGISGVVFDLFGWQGSSIVALVLLGVALSAHLTLYKTPRESEENNNNYYHQQQNDDNNNNNNNNQYGDNDNQHHQNDVVQNQDYHELQEMDKHLKFNYFI
ncbi:hypothetical protein PPL_12419 [Heterostelium album PN500]|uniref:Major facilitator superfamily (MFS) profile domain-containing protein n=1 Tax=Heterostelium pallidum (strain ATCC 26659 / Pp 5 / PN500) TaxID=670386 RepID=D3BMJ8_HETP5|nr:hypothetical protein PPL_12419 [Heterostelium album PN500]EFA77210.1 hypothetical protein PPL_12419 [Heterostelium album PN500]|eukprot:XP_020429339.1 hypothetical protein PPL_12419 [Heterostelium album PN500]